MAERAYAPEDKQARRASILAAAGALFDAENGALPSAARIAEAAGLAKGTVYLYFDTKEAIFAEILLNGWAGVMGEVEAAFDRDEVTGEQISGFLDRLSDYFADHPSLLRLDALGYGVIERNLGPETLLAFKSTLTGRLLAGGTLIDRALDLTAGRGVQLLMRTYALTCGLWRSFDTPGSDVAAPDKLHRLDFRGELAEALGEYWRGALKRPL